MRKRDTMGSNDTESGRTEQTKEEKGTTRKNRLKLERTGNSETKETTRERKIATGKRNTQQNKTQRRKTREPKKHNWTTREPTRQIKKGHKQRKGEKNREIIIRTGQ